MDRQEIFGSKVVSCFLLFDFPMLCLGIDSNMGMRL